jgi:hypothetical protein
MMALAMEPDQNLRLDSSVKIRLEREWIYFKLKHKVDTCETVQLGEIKELNQLLAEIEGSMMMIVNLQVGVDT